MGYRENSPSNLATSSFHVLMSDKELSESAVGEKALGLLGFFWGGGERK